jgi:hypothetical protein
MRKTILALGIIFLFISVCSIQVTANDNSEIKEEESKEELVWKTTFGEYNFNLPNGAKIDYLFKIKKENYLRLFGVTITSMWGGTSYVTPFSSFKPQYEFIRDEIYVVKMLYTRMDIFPVDFEDRPYYLNDPLGGAKFWGIGVGIQVSQ